MQFVMTQNQTALQNDLKKNSEMTLFFFPVDVPNNIFFQQSYVSVGHWSNVEEKCAKMQK